ncbi:MAG TPA: acyl-CoA dehydrogenase family protein [Mycobacteriales bacterium]|nr:acyl-CoA dehydrogenase family protein [Mycobacteriales bacterium]
MTTAVQAPGAEEVAARARSVVDEVDPRRAPRREFLGACFDAGLAWVHFPVGRGGLGASPALQGVANRVLQGAGGPDPFSLNPMGYGMAGPTLMGHGSPALQERHLRPLYTAQELWCQLFSEPGAGSDLAGLATRAERSGDEWVVSGQKVWTSLAHRARWALLLARTDPDQPKHRGLTYFVLDMQDPGVEVRPLRQLTGDAEFNEVYLTGARIPDSARLGDVGQGWRVAMTTLMNERSAIGGGPALPGAGALGAALALWRSRPELRTPVLRDRLAGLYARSEAVRLTGQRLRGTGRGGDPGPEGSLGKLVNAELNQELYAFCTDLLGPEGTLYDTYEPGEQERDRPLQRAFLRSRANTIEGGTSEVLRNVLAERVLGLPGDPRDDRTVPWREVPRG